MQISTSAKSITEVVAMEPNALTRRAAFVVAALQDTLVMESIVQVCHINNRLIIGSDRRSETKEGKIDRCRSCVRSPI